MLSRSAPGGKAWRGHHRAAQRQRAGRRCARSRPAAPRAAEPRGAITAPAGSGPGRPTGVAARAEQRDLAERHACRSGWRVGCCQVGAVRAAARARARAPARSVRSGWASRPASASRGTSEPGHDDGVAAVEAALHGRRSRRRRRDAATACRRPEATASAPSTGRRTRSWRSRRACRRPARGRLRAGRRAPPAISSAWLRATGIGPSGVTSQVTSATCAAGLPVARRLGGAARPWRRGHQVVERDHAVGEACRRSRRHSGSETRRRRPAWPARSDRRRRSARW